jgi:hypothetical protein
MIGYQLSDEQYNEVQGQDLCTPLTFLLTAFKTLTALGSNFRKRARQRPQVESDSDYAMCAF